MFLHIIYLLAFVILSYCPVMICCCTFQLCTVCVVAMLQSSGRSGWGCLLALLASFAAWSTKATFACLGACVCWPFIVYCNTDIPTKAVNWFPQLPALCSTTIFMCTGRQGVHVITSLAHYITALVGRVLLHTPG